MKEKNNTAAEILIHPVNKINNFKPWDSLSIIQAISKNILLQVS
jgi:hypothetical protein